MTKWSPPEVNAGYRSTQKISEALEGISDVIENTVSRDGATPNHMLADFDMNGFRILNLPEPVDDTDVVRLIDLAALGGEDAGIVLWSNVLGKPAAFTPAPHTHVTSDIVNFQESIEDLIAGTLEAGANITITYNDTTGKVNIASGAGGGGGSVDWPDITNKPSTFAPSAHTQAASTITDLQEVVEDYIGSSILAGAGISVSYNDTTGKTTIASSGGGGGSSGAPDFVAVFGGIGDGATSNNTAFAAAEGSSYEYIWLPEGNFYTTNPLSYFNKHYIGPGKIFYGSGGGSVKGFARYKDDVDPDVLQGVEYGIGENLEFSDAEYRVVNAGTRKNFERYLVSGGAPNGYPTYFWAPVTPHFLRYVNQGGWSGFSGLTTSTITAGVSTSCTISGGVTGWQVGDEVGFTSAMDGLITETKVLTGVDTGTNTISWSGTLANTYASGSTVTHGYRTMNSAYLTILDHIGGGDAYVHAGRATVSYAALNSQTNFEHRATIGLFGGDMTIAAAGGYATGWENQISDTGVDGCAAGFVTSYARTVDTGNFGNFWIHDLAKMDGGGTGYAPFGTKPMDGIYVAALAAKVGLDFTRSAFSVAAVALPLEAKIALDAQIVAPGAGNGNGWVATTDGGMNIRGTSVSGTKTLELNNGSYRMRLQASGALTTNAALTVSGAGTFGGNIGSSGGYVHGAAGLYATQGQRIQLTAPGGNDTYFYFDGSNVILVKNGGVVATW